MLDTDRFLYLMNRYELRETSPEEDLEYFAFFKDPSNRDEIGILLTRQIISTEPEEITHPEHLQEMLDRILGKVVVMKPKRRIFWAAAAAVLIGISFSTFFIVRNGQNKPSTVNPVLAGSTINDVAPGGNKAVLTLTNGSQIILDSAHNGLLANQGNTSITKTDSGKLAYNTSTEKPIEIGSNTLTTPRGGQFQLMLPDGTKVWLNAASSITYPTAFVGNTRKVTITGEAYFEVAKDKSKPFLVFIPPTVNRQPSTVEVLGTHFNINAYPDENSVSTTLLEGSVKIILNGEDKMLKPGEQAWVKKDGKIDIFPDANIKKVMAWKNGQFRFEGDDFETVMRQISRWYDVNVINENRITGHVTAVISRNVNVSEVFKMLEQTGFVHFQIDGKTVTVLK